MGEIFKKVQENRLKWYEHVLRREDEYVGKRVMAMEVTGKRTRARPKLRWLHNIKNDLSERELSGVNGGVSQETWTPHKSGKRCRRRRCDRSLNRKRVK